MKTSEQETKLTDSEKEKQNESEARALVVPPDGGWGWFIVFASFMCNCIVDGIIFSFGLFLVELAHTFNESKAKVAWVGSLLAGFYLIAGPLVSALANTFGCRPVTIAGSILASIGFLLSVYATNLIYLCITFGVIGGIGFGFIYLPAIVTVGFYFEQRRAFATGIAVCGSGVGAFIMSPLVKLLVEHYGWRGAMLVLSGIILNCAVFGSLFRPLEPQEVKPLLLRIKEAREAMRKWDSEEYIDDALLQESNNTNLSIVITEADDQKEPLENQNDSEPKRNDSISKKDNEKLSSSNEHTDCTSSPTGSNNSPPPPYNDVVRDGIFSLLKSNHKNNIFRRVSWFSKGLKKQKNKNWKKECCNKPFYRQDILYSASLIRLPEFRSQPDIHQYHMSVTKIPSIKSSENEPRFMSGMAETIKQLLDFSLLRSPTFLLLCASGFLTLSGFFVPFMFIIDRAELSGITESQTTFILPVIGITNTIGRVFCGWISDKPRVNVLMINNCALVIGGLATFFSNFFTTFYLLIMYAAIFGFSIACFAALRSIICVELLGLEKLTNAFGLLLLFQGIASIIGAPIAGLFYDSTGSYDASFYISGSVIAISGLMCFGLPFVSRWERRRRIPLEQEEDEEAVCNKV